MERWGIIGVWAVGALMIVGCATGPQSHHLSPEAEQVILKAWNTGDVGTLDPVLHEELRFSVNGCVNVGPDAYKKRLTQTRAAHEKFSRKRLRRLVDGDVVVAEWRWTGIPKGQAMPVHVEGVTLFRFEDGLLVEGHQYGDSDVGSLSGETRCETVE